MRFNRLNLKTHLSLDWDLSPELDGLLIEHVFECKKEGSCENTLGDLGPDAYVCQ